MESTATTPSILHVTTVHSAFDTRIFFKEARSLAQAGFNVSLATTLDAPQERDGVRLLPLGARGGSRFRRVARGLRAMLTIFRNRDAIVHIHDPELLLFAALPLLAGARVVYDVHEFYHDRIPHRTWIPTILRKPIGAIYDRIERILLPRFAGVVIAIDSMADRYAKIVPPDRVALVRNYPNISVASRDKARTEPHPLGGKPYVLHTGGASKQVAFHAIVRAAEVLRELGSPFAMVNIGETDLSEYSQEQARELMARAQAAGLVMLERVDHDVVLQWLAHASAGYIPLIDTENHRRALPNKLFEYLLFGLPVVATDIGHVRSIVTSAGAGELVPGEDGEAHARALMAVVAHRARYAQAAERAGLLYSFSAEAERLRSLYQRIDSATATE